MAEWVVPLIQGVATVIAATAAVSSFLAVRKAKDAAIGSTLLRCFEAYVNTMRGARAAAEQNSQQACDDFYRELFDLHWSEFHLWRKGLLPDEVMKAWLSVRNRNYQGHKLHFKTDEGNKGTVSYKDTWEKLKDTRYFERTDPFVWFMDEAHEHQITDMKTLRKNLKEREHGK